jgi:hypothetical protein
MIKSTKPLLAVSARTARPKVVCISEASRRLPNSFGREKPPDRLAGHRTQGDLLSLKSVPDATSPAPRAKSGSTLVAIDGVKPQDSPSLTINSALIDAEAEFSSPVERQCWYSATSTPQRFEMRSTGTSIVQVRDHLYHEVVHKGPGYR